MHAFNSGPWEVEAVGSLRSSLAWSIELRDTQVYIEKLWKRLHVDWQFHVDRAEWWASGWSEFLSFWTLKG